MTARFPLFSYPPNIAETLLKDLKLEDLFELSQLSKRAFNLARSTALLYKQNASLTIKLRPSSSIELFIGEDETVKWNFHSHRDHERCELEDQQRVVKIDNSHLIFARKSSNCYGCASNSIKDVLQFAQYISNLFAADVDFLLVEGSQIPHLKAILSSSLLRKSHRVFFGNGTVSHEVMRAILRGFECDQLFIWCGPEPNFQYDLPISFGYFHFQLANDHWFKGPMLLTLDCQHLMLVGCQLTDKDINTFIHHWVVGTVKNPPLSMFLMKHHENMESAQFYRDNREQLWNLEGILQGLRITQQPLPSNASITSTTVHREIDDRTLNIMVLEREKSSKLVIQSDFNPVDDSTCPLVHFSGPFKLR